MELFCTTTSEKSTHTISALRMRTWNGPRLCWVLQDGVGSKERIPGGRYEVKLRKEGGFHTNYTKRFGDFHRGMIELQDVPGFKYILVHIGNSPKDTRGCLLTGTTWDMQSAFIGSSEAAYKLVYKLIADRLEAGERVWITVP